MKNESQSWYILVNELQQIFIWNEIYVGHGRFSSTNEVSSAASYQIKEFRACLGSRKIHPIS